MENPNPVKNTNPFGPFFIALIFGIFWGLLVFLLPHLKTEPIPYLPQRPLSTKKNIGLNELMAIGRQDLKHENLISQIRKDLKIPKDNVIKVFIGPYANITGEGRLVDSNKPFGFVLLLDEIFYKNLTAEEKIALISHELGHLTNETVFLSDNIDTGIQFQIEADTYATKYARPEAMISILNKVSAKYNGLQSRQYYFRIKNLERIKRLRQAR